MRRWHFSDTHTHHNQLEVPENIDIAIFSGDCSNPRDSYINNNQVRDFIDWFGNIKVKHKIFVAGNHDVSIERRLVTPGDFAEKGIIYLENDSTYIEGLKIWGSPITPSFGVGWAYNKDRGKIGRIWNLIPEDTDIIVAHGPAKGILDLSYNIEGKLEYCGCKSLRTKIFEIKPKLFLSGHIHDMDGVFNAGQVKLPDFDTIFSNGSVVMDGKFEYGAIHNGNIFEL